MNILQDVKIVKNTRYTYEMKIKYVIPYTLLL